MNWVSFPESGHEEYICPGDHDHGCMFCDGGLFACPNCGSFEGATTTFCPGEKMTAEQRDAVYAGRLDFRPAEGGWVEKHSQQAPGWWLSEEGKPVLEATLAEIHETNPLTRPCGARYDHVRKGGQPAGPCLEPQGHEPDDHRDKAGMLWGPDPICPFRSKANGRCIMPRHHSGRWHRMESGEAEFDGR